MLLINYDAWLIVSGIVNTALYPLAAHKNAKPIPVLPLVGSTIVSPGLILPSRLLFQSLLKQFYPLQNHLDFDIPILHKHLLHCHLLHFSI